eukprot:scaffold1068_cov167-Amphora_coffeaeformis.AAC.21
MRQKRRVSAAANFFVFNNHARKRPGLGVAVTVLRFRVEQLAVFLRPRLDLYSLPRSTSTMVLTVPMAGIFTSKYWIT